MSFVREEKYVCWWCFPFFLFLLFCSFLFVDASLGVAAPLEVSAGSHPYFSRHQKEWKQLIRLLRATKQLNPVQPRKFPLAIPAWDTEKRPYSLLQHQGEFLLLTRWATWCKSCKYDLRAKRKLLRSFSNDPFVIIGVTHESFKVAAHYQKTAPAAKTFSISLVDTRGRFARYFLGMAYPATTLVDPWGWIIADRVGPGLWVTKPYYALFRFLVELEKKAWRELPQKNLVCSPKRKKK